MTEFKVMSRGGDELPFEGEPVAVFRFREESTEHNELGDHTYIRVDSELEDPDTCDFFFVLKEMTDLRDALNGDIYLCEWRGQQLICLWVNPPPQVGNFSKFSLPLIRKSYPKLIAAALVGVQPMKQPTSLLFYMRYQYAKNKGQKPNV